MKFLFSPSFSVKRHRIKKDWALSFVHFFVDASDERVDVDSTDLHDTILYFTILLLI